MRFRWVLIALIGCQTPPCPPVVEGGQRLTMLVNDVAPSSKGILRITALVLNAPDDAIVVGSSAGELSQTWSPATNGKQVSFLVEGNDTVRVLFRKPLLPESEVSNAVTVVDGRVEVERPTPDLFLAARTEFKMINLLVPGALPDGVRLFNGRGAPVSSDDYECVSSTTPWLKRAASVCWVWFYDPVDERGFRGAQLQAVVDTPAGPVRTRMITVR